MRKPLERWTRGGIVAVIAGCAAAFSCDAVLGIGNFEYGECNEGPKQFVDGTWQECVDGQWVDVSVCDAATNVDGECKGVCVADSVRCADDTAQECNDVGEWITVEICVAPEHCQAGECIRECGPGDVRCTDAGLPEFCDRGVWQDGGPCGTSSTCCLGECCSGECCSGACCDAGCASDGGCQ